MVAALVLYCFLVIVVDAENPYTQQPANCAVTSVLMLAAFGGSRMVVVDFAS